ncbi:MAG: PilW family protein [Gemmata sp.]
MKSSSIVTRRGFSLTELMVAMTIALMIMGAVATLFGMFGRSLSSSQATVDLAARMRGAAWQLRKDLGGVTCEVVPWLAPEADAGYFEYVEGPRNDQSAAHGTASLEADTYDVVLFTARSLGEPFVGAAANGTVEAECAEMAWFCRPMPSQPVTGVTLHNLHRRQLLVAAVPGAGPFGAGAAVNGSGQPYSVRVGSDGRTRPNSLGDLTKREHRFLRENAFPFEFQGGSAAGATLDGTDQEGNDIVLGNVIAFDVRAFDPQASSYVDLGGGGTSLLGAAPQQKSGLTKPTYDTWSCHYEFANQSGGALGEAGQYTTSPPYLVPLRGIEVRIRCYEPTSKQVRQVTVRHTFVKK